MKSEELVAVVLALAVITGVAFATNDYPIIIGTNVASLTTGKPGRIVGAVNVGPTSPVCRVNTDPQPAQPPWSQISVAIRSSSGWELKIPIDMTIYDGCSAVGNYHATVPPGTYQVDVSYCISSSSFGCSGLPKTATVDSGNTTVVNINIDTGIR